MVSAVRWKNWERIGWGKENKDYWVSGHFLSLFSIQRSTKHTTWTPNFLQKFKFMLETTRGAMRWCSQIEGDFLFCFETRVICVVNRRKFFRFQLVSMFSLVDKFLLPHTRFLEYSLSPRTRATTIMWKKTKWNSQLTLREQSDSHSKHFRWRNRTASLSIYSSVLLNFGSLA